MFAASLDSLLPSSKGRKPKDGQSRKPSSVPSVHIASDLPCPADNDVDDLPQPRYVPEDISRIQRILLHFVPTELADAILDMAEFWPSVSVSRNAFMSACSAMEAPDGNAQWCYLVSPKIPAFQRNGVCLPTAVKKVDFSIKTYESSFGKTATNPKGVSRGYKTWFESLIMKSGQSGVMPYDNSSSPNDWFANTAAPHPKYLNDFGDVEYPGNPVESPLDGLRHWHVRNNPQSNSDKEWHQVTWRQGDPKQVVDIDCVTGEGSGAGFVDSLEVDDQIVLMARAMSPGWINLVFNVKIDIYYAFSSSYL